MELDARIRQRRLDQHLSQTQLAELIEVDQGTLSRWEKGKPIDSRYYPRIAAYLEVDVPTVARWAHTPFGSGPEPHRPTDGVHVSDTDERWAEMFRRLDRVEELLRQQRQEGTEGRRSAGRGGR